MILICSFGGSKGRGARCAFTLVEMLCIMMMLTVLWGVTALLMKELFDVEQAQTQAFNEMLQTSELTDLFRADANRAEKAPQTWNAYQAGAHTLILQMPNTGHVVYGWQQGQLERTSFDRGKVTVRTFPVDGARVEFVQPGSNDPCLRLRVHVLKHGSPVAGRTLEIAAAVGGDWR